GVRLPASGTPRIIGCWPDVTWAAHHLGSRLNRGARIMEKAVDAIALLKRDHKEVKAFFDSYESLTNARAKGVLAEKICLALKIHTKIEEEIFYPAARKATKDDDLLDEAIVEHAGAKELISQIE